MVLKILDGICSSTDRYVKLIFLKLFLMSLRNILRNLYHESKKKMKKNIHIELILFFYDITVHFPLGSIQIVRV